MTAHVHAALMAEYAKDAAETDRPEDLWEYRGDGSRVWKQLTAPFAWYPDIQYRRKPKPLELLVAFDQYGAIQEIRDIRQAILQIGPGGDGTTNYRPFIRFREVVE